MKTVLRQLLSSYQLGLKMTSPLYLKVEILILLEQEFQHVCQSTMPERPGCLPDPIIHCLGPFWLHQDFRLFRKIHSCSTPAQKVASLHFTTLCSKPFSLCFSLVQILTSPSVSFFFFFKLFKSLAYFDNVPIFCFNISIEFVSRIFFSIPCKLALGKYNLISEFLGTEVSMILHSI